MPHYKPKTEAARIKHVQYSRDYNRRVKTGFSIEVFDIFWKLQGGRCALCAVAMLERGTHPDSVTGDHCHEQSEGRRKHQRGLLCRLCNISLGNYEKWQRPRGLLLDGYEEYRNAPPRSLLDEAGRAALERALVHQPRGRRAGIKETRPRSR